MKPFVLNSAGKMLFPVILGLSILVLYRGHNLPGGGFIGGLLGAASFIFLGIGDSMAVAKKKLRIDPVVLLGIGLGLALASAIPGLLAGGYFMKGLWLPDFTLPLLGTIHVGTPLIFDVGVYLTVMGFVLHTTFSLASLAEPEGDVS